MIYRDENVAAAAQIRCLQIEIAALSRAPRARLADLLRERIRNQRRHCERTARALARCRKRRRFLLPRSITEVVVACGLGGASLTVALGLAFLARCVLAMISHT